MNFLDQNKLPDVAFPNKAIRTLSLIKNKIPVSKDVF